MSTSTSHPLSRVLPNRPLNGLYLSHWPVIVFGYYLSTRTICNRHDIAGAVIFMDRNANVAQPLRATAILARINPELANVVTLSQVEGISEAWV